MIMSIAHGWFSPEMPAALLSGMTRTKLDDEGVTAHGEPLLGAGLDHLIDEIK
jgi:hypothetical protein